MKVVKFCPAGLVLEFPVKGSSLREVLFITLSDEQKTMLKDLESFRLTKLNYGSRAVILGNQAVNVPVEAFTSQVLGDVTSRELFAEHGEWSFSRENYIFLD